MIKELRKKTDIELAELIFRLKSQLLEIRFKIANGETEGVNKTREIKRTVAIAMTVLSERKVKLSFTAYDTRLIKVENGKQVFTSVDLSKLSEANKIATKKIEKTVTTKKDKKSFIDKKDLKTLKDDKKVKVNNKPDVTKKAASPVKKISSKG